MIYRMHLNILSSTSEKADWNITWI